VALACGSNLLLGPENYIAESKLKMLSPEGLRPPNHISITRVLKTNLRFLSIGRSKMWDADANGYARGDGVASCVLKTLSQAIADGDHIECIIRETGLNQDGGQYM
jgi:acyl transferase domain-containing protein